MITARELFACVEKGADPETAEDVLRELASARAERDDRLKRCTHLIRAGAIREEDEQRWVRDNPQLALIWDRQRIQDEIVKESKAADAAIIAKIEQLEGRVNSWPGDLARMHKAEHLAAHLRTADSIAAQEEYRRLKQRCDELIDENPAGQGLTPADDRRRKKLALAMTKGHIAAYEPRNANRIEL